jgi:plasmid segregation protein ParM
MIIGVDVGYKNTKVWTKYGGDLFPSTIKHGISDFNKSLTLEIHGETYTVGEETGRVSVKLDKIYDETFRICLFTAIAKSMKDNVDLNVKLITGLPIDYYKSQKQDLINSLKGIKNTVVFRGEPKTFMISDVMVFPQSAGLLLLQPELFKGDVVTVDVGGLTVCVSYFKDMKLLKHRTYELGMLKVYDKLVQKIKSEYKVSYEPLQAESIIKNKKIIVDGERIDITELVNTTLRNHAADIYETVTLGLDEFSTSIRCYIGGGSLALKDYLKGTFIEQGIYTNVKAYYILGVNEYDS